MGWENGSSSSDASGKMRFITWRDASNVPLVKQIQVDGLLGNETLAGSAGPDHLTGGPGSDVLSGNAGDDRL